MSESNLMGLELYSIWNKSKNPRSKPADWFRYRKGIKHCNPNREMLKEILLPIFKTYADNYVWRIEEGEDPEKALRYAIANGTGLSNVTAGRLSVNLANDILDYFVDNGHVEILETKLKDAIETVQNSNVYKEMPYENV
jgi:hypothetical protein